MTLLFMDGMDLHGVTANIVDRYDTVDDNVLFGATIGRFGGGGINPRFDDLYLQKLIAGSPQTCIVSFGASKDNTLPVEVDDVIKIDNDTSSGLLLLKSIIGSHDMEVFRGATSLGTFVLVPTSWNWISIKLKASSTVGTIDIEVNGISVFTFAGNTVNSGSETCNRVLLGSNNAQLWTYDDLIITDIAGSAPFNDLLSDRRIDTIMPNAVGDNSDFTASPIVDNYLNVDELNPDDDTTYNESETSTNKDLYHMEPMNFTPFSIDAVNVVGRVTNPDGGTAQFKFKIKTGTTEGDGGNITAPAGYKYLDELFLVDPDTAAIWTESGVNAMQAGLEII